MSMTKPDRWAVLELAGALLLGGGVWARWGASWACILWGVMFLTVATIAQWPRRGEE